MHYFSTIILSAFITISLIPIMMRVATRFQIVDFPGLRKVHTLPIPRIGGLATALGAFVPVILWTAASGFVKAWLVGATVLVIFGLLDDMKGLGYMMKFTGQIFAALVVVFYGGVTITSLGTLLPGAVQLPGWVAVSLTIVAIVGVTNAINLADGLDGLAGGISLLVFCCIGYLAYLVGNNDIILLSLSLAGAIFGFLRYNTHPASLFMGDTGSQLLGFSAAVLAIKITQGDTPFSPVLPLIILGFPILDTVTVMVERIRNGRSPFSSDKNHFHHRLIHFGLYHTEAVFTIYVIQAMMIVAAIFFRYYNDWALVTFYIVFSVLVIGAFIVADHTNFQFRRYPLIDYVIKGRLRRIRDDNWIIRISFSISKIIIPLVLVFVCLFPAGIPGYISVIAVCFSMFIVVVRMFAKKQMGFCLRFVLYLTAPLLLYLIEEGQAAWFSQKILSLYHFSFAIITFFILLTVKFSRRTNGFRMTTMDFLIIFIAVVVPNLPDQSIQSLQLGLLSVEVIILLFSYEVLIKELRGRFDYLTASTLIALIMIGIRGITGY